MKNKEYTLYLDMDGVLVDFAGGYDRLTQGKSIAQFSRYYGEEAAKQMYLKAGSSFWSDLSWEHGGKDVWNASRDLFEHVYILSSTGTQDPDRGKIVELGKRLWVDKNMPEMPQSNVIIVNGKHLKQQYANKASILVDDVPITIKQWNDQGGFGILHTPSRYKNTIEDLEDIARPLMISELAKRYWK